MKYQCEPLIDAELTTNLTSELSDMSHQDRYAVVASYEVTTPTAIVVAAADVNATANTLTSPNHEMVLGLKVRATTSGGLPAGLATSTDYFVIPVDDNTIKLASSLANAQAGTAIDITTAGTGDHTITPTSIAGGNIKLQYSNGIGWTDVSGATAAITATGTTEWTNANHADDDAFIYGALRVVFTLTAGQVDLRVVNNKK